MAMDLRSRIKRPTRVSETLVMPPGQNGTGKIYDVCDHATAIVRLYAER